MAPKSYKTSAPGSLILMGEYAVLKGYPAIVASIDKRINVEVQPREDNQIIIESALGRFGCDLNEIRITKPFDYVLTAIVAWFSRSESQEQHPPGFRPAKTGLQINITSEFSHKVGLGSSAAVTVALIAALNPNFSQSEVVTATLEVIRQVQGRGSGADVAASVYGGVIQYEMDACLIKPLSFTPTISAIYSGEKTTTTDALKNFTDQNEVVNELGKLSQQAIKATKQRNWEEFGLLMQKAQNGLAKLGVSTDKINHIIAELSVPAKISGSGLGDCVIALGKVDNALPISLGDKGLC